MRLVSPIALFCVFSKAKDCSIPYLLNKDNVILPNVINIANDVWTSLFLINVLSMDKDGFIPYPCLNMDKNTSIPYLLPA